MFICQGTGLYGAFIKTHLGDVYVIGFQKIVNASLIDWFPGTLSSYIGKDIIVYGVLDFLGEGGDINDLVLAYGSGVGVGVSVGVGVGVLVGG